jgi:alpha-aminoadipic semialdehyde synthase
VKNVIGIRREDKNAWERRAPLTPADVEGLVREAGVDFVVQPSPLRAFPDSAYEKAGARIAEDLSACGAVLGIKEMPADAFRPGGAYVFFAHVIKGQSSNMSMLRDLLDKKCHLIDYEKVVDEQGRRLIFFGRHAGLAGMIDALWALGRRWAWEGTPNPLEAVRRALDYADLAEALKAVADAGAEIRKHGLPKGLAPFVCGFAGYGNVSLGAQEVFDGLGVVEVAPDAIPGRGEGSPRKIYKAVFREEDLVEPREPGRPFALQEYYDHPERYRSRFASYLPALTVLVNAVYWDARYPRLVTKAGLKRLAAGEAGGRLKVIGDLSCDLEGAVEATVRVMNPGNPVFVYDPQGDTATDGTEGPGVVVLAVDNLPAELPVEASVDFSCVLRPHIPALAKADFSADRPALPDPLLRGLIVHRGELTPEFRYIANFL